MMTTTISNRQRALALCLIFFPLLVLLLTACGNDGVAAAPEPAAGERPVTPEGNCAAATTIVNQGLGVSAIAQPTPITDPATGTTAPGCHILVEGTGADFPSFVTVAQALGSELAAAGWEEDLSYLADGPTGTATAFRKEGALALVKVGWRPSPDAGCPAEQPIVACKLSPSQQLFTITVEVMGATTAS